MAASFFVGREGGADSLDCYQALYTEIPVYLW